MPKPLILLNTKYLGKKGATESGMYSNNQESIPKDSIPSCPTLIPAGSMLSNSVHYCESSPAGGTDTSNGEAGLYVRGRKDRAVSHFSCFSRLPVEIRLMIWKAAFDDVDPAVSFCSFSDGRYQVSVNHRHREGSRLVSVALLIVERDGLHHKALA